jgi:hypothetical protein
LVGVSLGNCTPEYSDGDVVQTIEPWTPPDAWEDLSHSILNKILTDIDNGLENGSRYSNAAAATERAAWRVVVQHVPDRTEKQARGIIDTLVRNGVLIVKEYDDPVRREPVMGLIPSTPNQTGRLTWQVTRSGPPARVTAGRQARPASLSTIGR